MEIAGRKYKVKDTFDSIVTIPVLYPIALCLVKTNLGMGMEKQNYILVLKTL